YREFQHREEGASLAMEGLVLELLAYASSRSDGIRERRAPPWLIRAREFLHECFTERFALEKIAGAIGVHPVHLCRAFRQHHGCTPGDYVRQLRVGFASS